MSLFLNDCFVNLINKFITYPNDYSKTMAGFIVKKHFSHKTYNHFLIASGYYDFVSFSLKNPHSYLINMDIKASDSILKGYYHIIPLFEGHRLDWSRISYRCAECPQALKFCLGHMGGKPLVDTVYRIFSGFWFSKKHIYSLFEAGIDLKNILKDKLRASDMRYIKEFEERYKSEKMK